jgi:hypothetical protein
MISVLLVRTHRMVELVSSAARTLCSESLRALAHHALEIFEGKKEQPQQRTDKRQRPGIDAKTQPRAC